METFQCPACDLKFRYPSELDDHIAGDHPRFEWRPRSTEGALFGASHRTSKRAPRYVAGYVPGTRPLSTKLLSSRSLVGISRNAEVTQAAELMDRKNIGALGVYTPDGTRLVGLITERDVTRSVARHEDPATTKVAQVMTPDPTVVMGSMSVDEAARLMVRSNVRHLVMRDQGRDKIVSLRDVLDPARWEESTG